MIQFPTSGAPGAPVSQGSTVPLSNVGYGMYPQTQLFTNPPYVYPSAPNMVQPANVAPTNMITASSIQGMPSSGGQQLGMGGVDRSATGAGVGVLAAQGAQAGQSRQSGPSVQNATGGEKRRNAFQQIVSLLFQTNTMSKDEADRLFRKSQDVKDEDLMTCLKDAVGNEQLAAAIKLLHSGPQRKSTGLPSHPSEGFMQRGTMAGVNQAGMSQQHLSQLQTQPVGGMRRQIPQQHAPPRDVGRQAPSIQRQDPLVRHATPGPMSALYSGNGQHQRPHVIGVASSGPAVGMPLSMGMQSSARYPSSYPITSVGYQAQSSMQILPGSAGTQGTAQVQGVTTAPQVTTQYQRMVPTNLDWNRTPTQRERPKEPIVHAYPSTAPAHTTASWGQSRTGAPAPNGHPFIVQQSNVSSQSQQASKPVEPQVGEKRAAPLPADNSQKRLAVDTGQSTRGGRPKPRRPVEDANAPDAAEGDVVQGAAIELADEQEALLGQFKTVRQSEPERAVKGLATARSIKSWVNEGSVQEKLNRVLRQNGITGMSPDCVEAMVRGIELKFEGMIKKSVTTARHRKPVAEGQRGIRITSDIRGKLREARKAEAEKQASKERAERAKLEKLAETATQTATKKELAGNKELAAKVEKVKRERILSAEAAAANRALSMAFGGLGFEKFRKMKREKEAAEKAKQEERSRFAKEQEATATPSAAAATATKTTVVAVATSAAPVELAAEAAKQDISSSGELKPPGSAPDDGVASPDCESGKEPEKSVIQIQVNDLLCVLGREAHYTRSKELQRLYLSKR